jgi:hypothetical protein
MKNLFIISAVLVLLSCGDKKTRHVHVKNTLPIARNEVVSISMQDLDSTLQSKPVNLLQVLDSKTKTPIKSQWLDKDGDGKVEELIFPVVIDANEERSYELQVGESAKIEADSVRTYSRFVPERIDDYAWENDLVAFRTYGPEAQRLVDEGEKGGTLSSGLDCWLKRVNYSIIDKWYRKPALGGTYHKDDGEGYDPYHVGDSRGCGGVGVWKDDSLYVSKNFVSYKKIADGPVRNIFELTYAPWQAAGITIVERKRITIDLGNQLYQVEDILEPSSALPNLTIGVTLHNKTGVVKADTIKGWFSYWESIDDSHIGTGVVVAPKYLQGFEDYRTSKKDLSQLHIITNPIDNTVVYYAGFGWDKAGIITTGDKWNVYLDQFAQRLASPLQVTLK